MTQEEKQILIAESQGWTRCFNADGLLIGIHPTLSMGRDYLSVPDYFNDLNACKDMEGSLEEASEWFGEESSGSACEAYMNHIQHIVKGDDWGFCCATPEIRCEAFGRTMKLWKEGE